MKRFYRQLRDLARLLFLAMVLLAAAAAQPSHMVLAAAAHQQHGTHDHAGDHGHALHVVDQVEDCADHQDQDRQDVCGVAMCSSSADVVPSIAIGLPALRSNNCYDMLHRSMAALDQSIPKQPPRPLG